MFTIGRRERKVAEAQGLPRKTRAGVLKGGAHLSSSPLKTQ